jgi:hypothetical protein
VRARTSRLANASEVRETARIDVFGLLPSRVAPAGAAGFFHDQNQHGKQSLICALDRGEVFRD